MGVVLLVRHGQASFGADDYDALSERGWEQSRLLGRWLADQGLQPNRLVHGTLRRQRETAEALREAAGWGVTAAGDAGWDEFDARDIVPGFPAGGQAPDRGTFQRDFAAALERWVAAEPGGYAESYLGFVARVEASFARAREAAGSGAVVVVSSSGGPVSAAVASLLEPEATPRERAGLWQRMNAVVLNASYSRVVVGRSGTRLLTFNEHSHLGEDLITYR